MVSFLTVYAKCSAIIWMYTKHDPKLDDLFSHFWNKYMNVQVWKNKCLLQKVLLDARMKSLKKLQVSVTPKVHLLKDHLHQIYDKYESN